MYDLFGFPYSIVVKFFNEGRSTLCKTDDTSIYLFAGGIAVSILYLQSLENHIFANWSKIVGFLQCVPGESILSQKYAFIKKSTIFTQSLRNFVKMRS